MQRGLARHRHLQEQPWAICAYVREGRHGCPANLDHAPDWLALSPLKVTPRQACSTLSPFPTWYLSASPSPTSGGKGQLFPDRLRLWLTEPHYATRFLTRIVIRRPRGEQRATTITWFLLWKYTQLGLLILTVRRVEEHGEGALPREDSPLGAMARMFLALEGPAAKVSPSPALARPHSGSLSHHANIST